MQEGVVLVALEPLLLFLGGFATFAARFFLYGVQRYGFLHLFDSAVVGASGFVGFFYRVSSAGCMSRRFE